MTDDLNAASDPSPREAELDLDDAHFDEEFDAAVSARPRARRSAIVSGLVVIIGTFLLLRTWGDFRFWMRSDDDVRSVGHVAKLVEDGRLDPNLVDELVEIEGTPDVQSAARFTNKDGYVGFLRLIESGTALFAAIPRDSAKAPAQFPTTFVGRVRPLSETSARRWVEEFFAAERIVEHIEIDPSDLVTGLKDRGSNLQVRARGSDAPVVLAHEDNVQLVLAGRYAVAQLGRGTWRRRELAEARVASLGLPYAALETDHPLYFSFVIDAVPDRFDALTQQLEAGMDIPRPNADPSKGAMLVPRRVSHVTTASSLEWLPGGRLGYRVEDPGASLGWRAEGQTMVEVPVIDGRVELTPSAIADVRVDRSLRVGAHTHVIHVGERPSSRWLEALSFLLALGLVLSNLVTVIGAVRRWASYA